MTISVTSSFHMIHWYRSNTRGHDLRAATIFGRSTIPIAMKRCLVTFYKKFLPIIRNSTLSALNKSRFLAEFTQKFYSFWIRKGVQRHLLSYSIPNQQPSKFFFTCPPFVFMRLLVKLLMRQELKFYFNTV